MYPESVMLASCLLFRYIGIFGSCIMVFFLFYGFGFLGQISFFKWYVKDHLIVTFKIYLKDGDTERKKNRWKNLSLISSLYKLYATNKSGSGGIQ